MCDNTAGIIREDVGHRLRMSMPSEQNIPAKEPQAFRRLRRNEYIIELPSDKGNATVIMNMVDYKQKVHTLLEDSIYKPISTYPTMYLDKATPAKSRIHQ